MTISRKQLFSILGINAVVEPVIEKAYAAREKHMWESGLGDSPHGYKWHTKFHASSFPGNSEACSRKLVYGLMDLPDAQPISGTLRRYAEVGEDAEERLVKVWEDYGVLLSAGVGDEYQTNFSDKEAWLSGNCDAMILPFGYRSPHVVEIKSRSLEKVQRMKVGAEKCDPKHESQCRSYISMAHQNEWQLKRKVYVCRETWQISKSRGALEDCRTHGHSDCLIGISLEPCKSGTVLYVARDNPNIFHEFTFEYDPEWYESGKNRLIEAKENFLDNKIPDRPKHENGKYVGWSEEPCKWCPLKKHICKPDYQDGIDNIEESHAMIVTKEIKESYNYEEARQRVLDTWK